MRVIPDSLRPLRHTLAVRFQRRTSYTFTRFLRLPRQYEALGNIVVPSLVDDPDTSIEIVVLGCSIGAEPYSIASVLTSNFPNLRYQIRAFDIDESVLDVARVASYHMGDVLSGNTPDWFIAQTFDVDGENCSVKASLRNHITFGTADVLDKALSIRTGHADLVFCQNLLVNLPYDAVQTAFWNVLEIGRTRSVMFLDGMPLGPRERLTYKAGLQPLAYLIAEIHQDVRRLHGEAWPWHYWGIEPMAQRGDWKRRYATIFTHGM